MGLQQYVSLRCATNRRERILTGTAEEMWLWAHVFYVVCLCYFTLRVPIRESSCRDDAGWGEDVEIYPIVKLDWSRMSTYIS